jgi:hypothetical protein
MASVERYNNGVHCEQSQGPRNVAVRIHRTLLLQHKRNFGSAVQCTIYNRQDLCLVLPPTVVCRGFMNTFSQRTKSKFSGEKRYTSIT